MFGIGIRAGSFADETTGHRGVVPAMASTLSPSSHPLTVWLLSSRRQYPTRQAPGCDCSSSSRASASSMRSRPNSNSFAYL